MRPIKMPWTTTYHAPLSMMDLCGDEFILWPYGDKTTVYLALVVHSLIKVVINTGLVLRQNMLCNKEDACNKAKANQDAKRMILVQTALIEGLKIKGAF
jgi:hypothetical protein